MQRDDVVERTDRDEIFAVVEHPPPDSGAAGLGQRVVQQPVGPARVLALGAEVVGPVKDDGVDLVGDDELVELDHVSAVAGGGVDLVLAEHHVRAVRALVSLDDLFVGDLAALLGADAALLELLAVGGVDLMEMDRVVLGGRVDLDRHRDPTQHHRPVPDRPRHGGQLPRLRQA